MTPARLRGLSILTVAALNALLVLAWSQAWVEVRTEGQTVAVPGSSAGGAVLPLALSGLVLGLALLLAGPVFRVILGVLQALLGACVVYVGVVVSLDPGAAAAARVAAETGLSGRGDAIDAVGTWWPTVAAGLGLALALVGAAIAVTSSRWPRRTERFDRTRMAEDAGADPVREWDALSEGEDPTNRSG